MVRRVRMRHVTLHVIYPEETEREKFDPIFVGNTYTVNNVKQKNVEMLSNFIWVQMSKIGIRNYLKRK